MNGLKPSSRPQGPRVRFVFEPSRPVGRLTVAGRIDPDATQGRLIFLDRRTTTSLPVGVQYELRAYEVFCSASKDVGFLIVRQAIEVIASTRRSPPVSGSTAPVPNAAWEKPKSAAHAPARQGTLPKKA